MKKIFSFLNKYQEILYRLVLFLAFVFFILLSWKNPYNDTSLIGNFDPFPDTMHYVVPARNFVLTGKFALEYNDQNVKIAVPPVYSWSLIPAYFINSDARTFYYVNIFLGLISIYLLYKISRRLSQSLFITGLILFLYTGTFVIFWQTQLAMSENILLPIMLGFILSVLQKKITYKNLALSTILAISLYGSKYAILPCTVFGILFIFGRIIFYFRFQKKEIYKHLAYVMIIAISTFVIMNGHQFMNYFNKLLIANLNKDIIAQADMSWFGFNYFFQSGPKYFSALMGFPVYNLWETKAILPFGLAALVLIWSLYALGIKKYRPLAILVIGFTAAQLSFLSLTAMIEGRYAFIFLPVIYTGLAAFCGWGKEFLEKHFGQNKTIIITLFLVILSAGAFSFYHLQEWKTQLLVNFHGSERPWWHIAMVKEDQILSQRKVEQDNFLISVMPPFMWNFYRYKSSPSYQIMPFSNSQDFSSTNIWANNGLSDVLRTDLPAFYASERTKGREIYLSTVGFNENYRKFMTHYEKLFNFEILDENCGNLCTLYHLTLKTE